MPNVLLADPAISAKHVAERLGVSLPTLYRHLQARWLRLTKR
jgi:predicted DNA-binding transcriptional regulator AlpA